MGEYTQVEQCEFMHLHTDVVERVREKLKDEQNQENWEFKNKPRASGSRGPSREKQPDGDLARLVALAVTGAKKGSEKKRLSSGGKSSS